MRGSCDGCDAKVIQCILCDLQVIQHDSTAVQRHIHEHYTYRDNARGMQWRQQAMASSVCLNYNFNYNLIMCSDFRTDEKDLKTIFEDIQIGMVFIGIPTIGSLFENKQ